MNQNKELYGINKMSKLPKFIHGFPLIEYIDALQNSKVTELIKNDELLTESHLYSCDFAALLRLASLKNNGEYIFPNAVTAISIHLNSRPLPLKLYDDSHKKIVFFEHQLEAIKYIRYRESLAHKGNTHGLCGSIIKLDMGLGKTLVAIASSLISPRPSYNIPHGERGFPTLIVASKTVMGMWKRDGFEKFFTDEVRVLYLHPDLTPVKAITKLTRKDILEYDFVVTTYDYVCVVAKKYNIFEETYEIGDQYSMMKGKVICIHPRKRDQSDDPYIGGEQVIFYTPWERVICDESQRFANPDTVTYKAMLCLYGRYKLCLTGTPIKNYDTDIWAQLRFCGYIGCKRKTEWKKNYMVYKKIHKLADAIYSVGYNDTEIELPNKAILPINTVFEGMEDIVYRYILGVTKDVYDMMLEAQVKYSCVLALFTRLRQSCIAPYLITDEAKRDKVSKKEDHNSAKEYLPRLYEGPLWDWVTDINGTAGINSTKMRLLISTIKNTPKDDKILIFSMFTSALDLIAKTIKYHTDFAFEQMDGDVRGVDRDDIQYRFNTDENIKALLLTYKVGSEGLNLTAANIVICLEPWWVDVVHSQAIARTWRPGQTKEVMVYFITIQNTIEERIFEICESKKEMAAEFLEGTEAKNKVKGLDKETLGKILGI